MNKTLYGEVHHEFTVVLKRPVLDILSASKFKEVSKLEFSLESKFVPQTFISVRRCDLLHVKVSCDAKEIVCVTYREVLDAINECLLTIHKCK